MADISKITLPDNATYNIKDKNARNFINTPYYEQDEEALMFQLGDSYMTGEQDNQPYLFRAAGGSADIGNREYDKIIGGTVAWNQLVRNETSTNEIDFADIVTVDDAVEDAAAVKVAIEPVQDLHGYDAPWPAGGGKNLIVPKDWSFTLKGVPCVCSTSAETISLEGTATGNGGRNMKMINDIVLPAGAYTLSVTAVSGIKKAQYIVNRTDNNTYVSERSFLLEEATSIYVGANVVEGTVYNEVVHIQIEAGTTASAWTPYSNICPITGWTGAKVTRTGKNLFTTVDWESSSEIIKIDSNSMRVPQRVYQERYNRYVFGKARPKTFSCKVLTEEISNDNAWFKFYLHDLTGLSIRAQQIYLHNVGYEQTVTITIPDTATEICFGGWRYKGRVLLSDMQMEFNTTATDYEPYAGNTYSITLPTEAGTVYGGELTVNKDGTGSLVVNRAVVDLGTLTWDRAAGGFYSIGVSQIIKKGSASGGYETAISSQYKTQNISSIVGLSDFGMSIDSGGNVQLKDSRYSSAAELKTGLNGVQMCYELATPITYSLTASEIRTLLGQNNIWADTGDLALTYTGTDEHLTLKSGRKYLTRISGTDSMLLGSGQEITVGKGTNNVFDITQMFGTTIADYIYSLETATPGAGVAWFRKLFPKPYYEYNAGELMSVQAVAHKLVGFNAWDEEWQLGIINTTTGEEIDSSSNIRSKNYIHVIPGATYYFKLGTTDISNNVVFYDAEKNYMTTLGEHVDDTFTVPENAHYMKFYMSTNYGSTYLSNICINLSGNGERDGEYEEYNMHSYPLDSSLVLRGIPKLNANNQLYYDGDVYEADGTVTRRYGVLTLYGTESYIVAMDSYLREDACDAFVLIDSIGIITTETVGRAECNLLTANAGVWSGKGHVNQFSFNKQDQYTQVHISVANSLIGVTDVTQETRSSVRVKIKAWVAALNQAGTPLKFVYKLVTPTIETAEPYDNPQIVDPEGTEEYITTNIVFVGHETKY